MKTAELLVKALENEGVEYVFGLPGEENLEVLEALRSSKIEMVLTRHEQAAGFMAAAYGRLNGKPGVCMATLGPGATNLVTAAAYAKLGGMPMVMITGQKSISKSKQGQFQIVNIVDMMKPLTKYTKQIVHPATLPSRVRKAFMISMDERPGPVHIELPEDVAREEIDEEIFPVVRYDRPVAGPQVIVEAVNMISKAQRPLILIGAGASRKKPSEAINYFISKTGIPFFSTQMGKGVVDERSPLWLGTAALSRSDFIHKAVERSDLIINFGHDVIEKPPFFMTRGGFQVIHVNFLPAIVDDVYFPQVEVVGDIANSVTDMAQYIVPSDNWQFDDFRRIKTALDADILEANTDNAYPIDPERLVTLVRAAMPDDGIVSLDNGIYKIWFARNYPAYKPNTLLLDNALATMGAGLPAAIAAKLVRPNVKVLAVCGDGGFMMNSQELETAIRNRLDLTVMVLHDNALGMIKWKQARLGFKEYGLDFGNPDFKLYAESYGAKGYTPASIEDLDETLRTCLGSPGVHVIDVKIDYSLNNERLNVQIPKTTETL